MKIKKFAKDESGSVIVIVALLLVVLLGFSAFTVDMGLRHFKKAKIQTVCDTAALAAASELPDITAATETAKYYVKENGLDPNLAVIEFDNEDTVATEVRVGYNEDLDTTFANIFGVKTMTVKCSATAGAVFTTGSKKKISAIFDFLLFQGGDSDLRLSSSGLAIHGPIHSNAGIQVDQLECIGGFSAVNDTLSTSVSFNIVRKNGETGNYDVVGKGNPNWQAGQYPPPIQVIDDNWQVTADDIKGTQFYQKQEDILEMPMYMIDNAEELLPKGGLPTITNYSGWTTVSSNLDSNLTSSKIHYTGDNASITTGKSYEGIIATDGYLKLNPSSNKLTIKGEIYCSGNMDLEAYNGEIVINGNLYVNGNLNFNTNGRITVNGNIYCTGNITSAGSGVKIFSDYVYCNDFRPGNTVEITGVILAEHDVVFTGSDNHVDGSLAVISKHGNINITAGSQYINGVIFAPEGKVTLGGQSGVYGNVIGKELGIVSAIDIYPMKDSTLEDLGDLIVSEESDVVTGGVKLLK